MEPGAFVVLSLVNPTEKYWGILRSLAAPGVTLRGIHLASFEDWMLAVAREEQPSLGPSTVFFPMARVERMFLDESMGEIESLRQRFERQIGQQADTFLEDG